MENTFLSNLQQEGIDDPFEGLIKEETPAESETPEKETPAESAPEIKPEGEPESSPEPKAEEPEVEEDAKTFHAFHEHPRWIAREEELKQLRSKVEEYDDFKSRVEPFLEKLNEPKKEEMNAPAWFSNLFGDNEDAWNQYREANKAERQQIRDEILKELKPDLEIIRQTKKQSEIQDWADKQWKTLSEDSEVQKELKSMGISLDKVLGEISEVMSKYKPSDDDGNISLKTSYELWKATRKQESKPNPNIAEKKKIAAISKSKEETETKDFKTSEDFRGKSIHDLVED